MSTSAIDLVKFSLCQWHSSKISFSLQAFTANAVYNKLYQHSLNIDNTNVVRIEPYHKVWFSIENGTIYALPFFGDYSGPFTIYIHNSNLIVLKLKFHFIPSLSLFSPLNHLLFALFNISSIKFNYSSLNRYFVVQTLSIALNLNHSLLTIHKINGSMIEVYFSCDLYSSTNLPYQINNLIDHYYSNRLQLIQYFPLPLIEISIVRLPLLKTTTPMLDIRTAYMTDSSRFLNNRTLTSLKHNSIQFDQFYQPLFIIPLLIILIGLMICTIVAFCLFFNRRSSSSSTLLLPSGPFGNPNNKHLYRNYLYHKHQQQRHISKGKYCEKDQRQFISKGKHVVFFVQLKSFICLFL